MDRSSRSRSRDRSPNNGGGNSGSNGERSSRSRERSRDRSRDRNNSGSRGRSTSREEDLAERRIYVGKLSSRTSRNAVEDHFKKFGKILSVDMKLNFCFVEFDNEKSAKEAIDAMDNQEIDGERIRVQKSHGGRKRNTDDSCYLCHGRGHWARNCPRSGYSIIISTIH